MHETGGDKGNVNVVVNVVLWCPCMRHSEYHGEMRDSDISRCWYLGEYTVLTEKQVERLKQKHTKCKEMRHG